MRLARWRQWHRWLGLTLGLVLLMMAITGGILVFKDELISLNLNNTSQPPTYSLEHLSSGLRSILAQHSAESVYYIKTPTQGRNFWWVALQSGEIKLFDSHGNAVTDRWNILPALHWIADFHTELLLADSGSSLLTFIAVASLLLMLAGGIIWWPGRSGFRFKHLCLLPTRRGPALRQHRAIAVFCLPLLLLSVISGGGMTVQSALGNLFSKDRQETQASSHNKPVAIEITASYIEQLLVLADKKFPAGEITMVGLPTAERPQLRLRFRTPGEWHINGKTTMLIDARNREISLNSVTDASPGRKILNTFYPLHSGFGLPRFYQAIVASTAVLTIWLALLGMIAWFKRR